MATRHSLLRRTARSTRLLLAAAASGLLLIALPAAAAAAPADPSANIPIGALPAACSQAPNGSACVNAVVVALDAARADLGFGPYVLPSDFDALPGDDQILILSNLDRLAYGLPPIAGLSPTLGTAAESGMLRDSDPDPTDSLGALSVYGWTSNWAGNWANAPYAYYEWMYDDGYDGSETSNIDCTSATASGCWVHRHNVLAFSQAGTLSLGASVGTDAHGDSSYATTLVWTSSTNWTTYSYTWAEAQAAGAGTAHSGRVELPRHSKHHHRRGGHS